jgi:hypothetical protein
MPALERRHTELVAPALTDSIGDTSDRVAHKLPDIPPTDGATLPDATVQQAPPPVAKSTPAEDEFEALKRRLDALKVRK